MSVTDTADFAYAWKRRTGAGIKKKSPQTYWSTKLFESGRGIKL